MFTPLRFKVSGRFDNGSQTGERGDRGALEAFVLWLTNIRVCAGELGAFDAHLCVGSACAGEA